VKRRPQWDKVQALLGVPADAPLMVVPAAAISPFGHVTIHGYDGLVFHVRRASVPSSRVWRRVTDTGRWPPLHRCWRMGRCTQ
jgi:hypothetical protein